MTFKRRKSGWVGYLFAFNNASLIEQAGRPSTFSPAPSFPTDSQRGDERMPRINF